MPFPFSASRWQPLAVFFAVLVSALTLAPAEASTTTVTYTVSGEDFLNPERGFHGNVTLEETTNLGWLRDEGYSLARAYVRLDDYRREPLPESLLADVERGLDAARDAGVKIVLRFAYNFGIGEDDTTLAWVERHIAQVEPLLERNADVITALQAGFIGAWGEWHSSENGLDTAENKALVYTALMDALPESRAVQLRYPADLINLYAQPLSAGEAFSGSAKARTGHNNDCFLSGEFDVGTYWPPEREERFRRYLEQLTQWTVTGGETCEQEEPPRFGCEVAVPEMERFHWDYLNGEFYEGAVERWQDEGCFEEISRRLGYRFELVETTAPDLIRRGSAGDVTIRMRNSGFGKLYNPRDAELVFRHQESGAEHTVDLTSAGDVRTWLPQPGEEVTLYTYTNVPSDLATGRYDLFLNLPDAAPSLSGRSEYSVRLANDGVWEEETGYNDLGVSLEVAP